MGTKFSNNDLDDDHNVLLLNKQTTNLVLINKIKRFILLTVTVFVKCGCKIFGCENFLILTWKFDLVVVVVFSKQAVI